MSLLFFALAALAQEPAAPAVEAAPPVEAPPVQAPAPPVQRVPASRSVSQVLVIHSDMFTVVTQGAVIYPHELPRGYQQSLARTVTIAPRVTPNFLANQPQLQLDRAPLLPVRGMLSATSPPRPAARPMLLAGFDPR